jgi:hypothetical protein
VIRATAYVHLAPGAGPDAARRLIDAVRDAPDELEALALDAAPTAAVTVGGGDVMLLAAFGDIGAYESARRHPYVKMVLQPLLERNASHVEWVRYTQGPVVVQDPALTHGVHRTLLLHVDPSVDPETVLAFERDLAGMTQYIDAIRNSSLSHPDEVHNPLGPVWTHVWEQEFADLDGLTGPYMQHAYHWALVDTWFDPQAPNRVVNTTLIHSACSLRRSILVWASP